MLVNSLLGNLVETNSSQINSILDIPSVLEFKQKSVNLENLNFYSCTVGYINSNAKAIYIYVVSGRPAIGFTAFLGNFVLTRFRCTASEARHLF